MINREALNCSEFPNNSDTISRQQAIDKFKPWLEVKGYGWGELNMLRAVISELENMPSVQSEQRWIPVSERLPEDDTRVQVTFANGIVGQSSWHKANEYNNGFDAVMHGVTDRHFVTFGVIAWKPLPEPYHGGEQE